MRMLSLKDLAAKGIKFSRQHLRRLIMAGKFPRPAKIGENTNAWDEAEIDAYLEARLAERGLPFVSHPPKEGPANGQPKRQQKRVAGRGRAEGERGGAAKKAAAA